MGSGLRFTILSVIVLGTVLVPSSPVAAAPRKVHAVGWAQRNECLTQRAAIRPEPLPVKRH